MSRWRAADTALLPRRRASRSSTTGTPRECSRRVCPLWSSDPARRQGRHCGGHRGLALDRRSCQLQGAVVATGHSFPDWPASAMPVDQPAETPDHRSHPLSSAGAWADEVRSWRGRASTDATPSPFRCGSGRARPSRTGRRAGSRDRRCRRGCTAPWMSSWTGASWSISTTGTWPSPSPRTRITERPGCPSASLRGAGPERWPSCLRRPPLAPRRGRSGRPNPARWQSRR